MFPKVLFFILIAFQVQGQRIPHSHFFPSTDALPYHPEFADVFSASSNLAGTYKIKSLTAGLAYEQLNRISELSERTALIAYPVQKGVGVLKLGQYGYENFRESNFKIGYSRSLGQLTIGGSLDYNFFKIPGYNGNSFPGFSVSSTIKLSEKVFYGIQIEHAGMEAGNMSTAITAGFSWAASDLVMIGGENFHSKATGNYTRLQLQYHPSDILFFNTGYISSGHIFLSTGLSYSKFRVSLAIRFVPHLGIQSGIKIIYKRVE